MDLVRFIQDECPQLTFRGLSVRSYPTCDSQLVVTRAYCCVLLKGLMTIGVYGGDPEPWYNTTIVLSIVCGIVFHCSLRFKFPPLTWQNTINLPLDLPLTTRLVHSFERLVKIRDEILSEGLFDAKTSGNFEMSMGLSDAVLSCFA